jgi:uncharacterized LabA/DUF88 family protein
MRVALFFDGNNYYRALRDFDSSLEINLERLAAWVTRRVGGDGARFVGAYYYTGTFEDGVGASDGGLALGGFLDVLETLNGFFVRREPRVRRVSVCRACQAANEYFTEKRVDTRMVAELIQLAAVDGFDLAFILSGDGDFVPAVQAVGALGKQVFIGAWPGQRVARELRAHSFGVVDLGQGIAEFSTGRRRGYAAATSGAIPASAEVAESAAPKASPEAPEEAPDLEETMLAEVRAAEAQLPYVSRWYFLNRWRGSKLPVGPSERERLLGRLIEAGQVEEYEITDANERLTWAIRESRAAAAPEVG